MIITFKTLQQKTFKIEINETATVKALKEKIAEERGSEFPVTGQKLIYAGKILDDDKMISEYKIDPVKNFVVVMAVKPKAKPVEKPEETSTSSSTSDSPSATTPAAVASTTESTAAATTTTSETTRPDSSAMTATTTAVATETITTPQGDPNSMLLTGSALEASILELMSLGFSRQQVQRALNSSYHNADRAAEYLLSGNIPEINDDETEPTATEGTTPPTTASGNTPGASGDISFLRNLPQFQMMRHQLQQHPDLLPQLLQEIGRENPQLLTLISQNQEAFIALLNEQVSSGDDNSSSGGGGGSVGGGGTGAGASAGGSGGGFQIQVTPDEKAAIDRLVSMGFNEGDVIQAYFACDKNEALTVEFLLKAE